MTRVFNRNEAKEIHFSICSERNSMVDPLSYNSFQDPHLQTYFGNKNIRKHLRKVGLVNRHGDVIPNKEYQTTIKERSRQEHLRALLSQGIVQRVMQMEKIRQSNIQKEHDMEAKRLMVENVKGSRQQFKEYRSTDFIKLNRPKTSNIHQPQIKVIDEQKSSPTRLKSLHPSSRSSAKTNRHKSPKTNKSNRILNDRCEITMIYLGGQANVDPVEIMVMQQHCGGENLLVFKNFLRQNEKFRFESRRYPEYPFALSLYVDGLIDSRISVCCEYKHKLNTPLGGIRSSFAILNVQRGRPCQRCRFNEYLQKKSSEQNSQITALSKSDISDQSKTRRLLRTPSPADTEQIQTLVSNENDEYKEAEELYKTLLEKLDENPGRKENGYIHCQLGNICKEGFGDYDKALEHYLTSLEIFCQKMSSLDKRLRNIYLSIAHILLLYGEHYNQLTIEYFQRILHIDKMSKNINEKYLINDHNYLGLLYQNVQEYSQSIYHFKRSLHYFSLIDSTTNFSENYFSNDYSFNETIFDKKALKSLSIDKFPDRSEIHFNLSNMYLNINDQENALKHAQKTLQLSIDDQKKFQFYQNYFNQIQII